MTLRGSFKRGLAVGATVGLIGVGAALAAAPANAADADYMHGPLTYGNGYTIAGPDFFGKPVAEFSDVSQAPQFQFPAAGKTGQWIYEDGRCMTVLAPDTRVAPQACNGSVEQSWEVTNQGGLKVKSVANGLFITINASGANSYFNAASTVGVTFSTNGVASGPLPGLPAPVADVVVTSPSAGGSIGTHGGVVAGTAQPNSAVSITVNGVVVGTGTADASGNFSVTLTSVLAEGNATVTVAAGGKSASVSTTVTPSYDFAITSPADSGEVVSGDVEFVGTAAPGTEVTISGPHGDVTVTADDEGIWKATVTVGDGPRSIIVTGGGKTIELTVVGVDDSEGTPAINVAVALGALVAAGAAGIGVTAKRRRLTTAA